MCVCSHSATQKYANLWSNMSKHIHVAAAKVISILLSIHNFAILFTQRNSFPGLGKTQVFFQLQLLSMKFLFQTILLLPLVTNVCIEFLPQPISVLSATRQQYDLFCRLTTCRIKIHGCVIFFKFTYLFLSYL